MTNLRVFWQEMIAGRAVAPPQARVIEMTRADLHYRGFSEPRISPTRSEPDHYDYSRLMAAAPWDALPGRYTRYGDVREIAAAWRVSQQHVRDLIEAGELAAVRVGGRNRHHYRIPIEAYEEFLRKNLTANGHFVRG